MSDPRRIKRMCEKLCIVWESLPEQRFGQLLENLTRSYGLFPYKRNCIMPWGQGDDKTEEILDRIIVELNKNNK